MPTHPAEILCGHVLETNEPIQGVTALWRLPLSHSGKSEFQRLLITLVGACLFFSKKQRKCLLNQRVYVGCEGQQGVGTSIP